MIPWSKLPKDLQKAILVMITLYGGSTAAACRPPGPLICDPAPAPTTSPIPLITPIICDPAPPPALTVSPLLASPTPTATLTPTATPAATPTTPIICDPAPPPSATPMIFDPPPAPSSFRETPSDGVFATLPLAEIRSVVIERSAALTFAAKTPWPGARMRWTASGGALLEDGQAVTWQPPAEPGRYLLQVVADWGQVGLAVDARVLEVGNDGRVAGA